MAIDFDALLKTFVAEATDGLARMEEDLLALEREPGDRDLLHDVFRLVHTLKGDAGSLGFPLLSRFAHRLEDHLEALRAGRAEMSTAVVTLLLEGVDALRAQLERAVAGAEREQPSDDALLARLADLLREEKATGSTESDAGAGAAESSASAAGPAPAASPFDAGATLRVEIERLDDLVDLVGELGIARRRIATLLADPHVDKGEILALHEAQDHLHAELQELALELRMVPIGPLLASFERAVRDLSRGRGKLVRLVVEGSEVGVDARLAERLRAPLAHMVRNAIDHGIEPPSVRVARGKEARGTLRLAARRDGGSLVVELADDGGGLDRERILAKAISLGLVGVDPPADEEIDQLIFLPGFSTVETIDDLSGRGVGMDVVRRTVEGLRGALDLSSRQGQGTTIRLRLPLSLGMIDGLAIAVGAETYVVPLDQVEEIVDLPAGRSAGSRGVLSLRGEALPQIGLRELLEVPGEVPDREQALVVAPFGERVGVAVDRLVGREQTVVRPLAPVLREAPGLAGSTILGTGEVAFVLDLATLLRRPQASPVSARAFES